jgi:hypothetical protein
MPVTLMRFAFVAALVYAAAPAWGAGMPDYGSKNFSPGGATPSYFTNENTAILGTAETDTDDGADASADMTGSTPESQRADRSSRYRVGHHHGKLAGRSFEARATSHSRARGGALRSAAAEGSRTASSGRASGRWAHAAPAASARSARTGGTRPAKAAARHASARSWSRKG